MQFNIRAKQYNMKIYKTNTVVIIKEAIRSKLEIDNKIIQQVINT